MVLIKSRLIQNNDAVLNKKPHWEVFLCFIFFSGTGSYFGLNKGLHVKIRFDVKSEALTKLKRV